MKREKKEKPPKKQKAPKKEKAPKKRKKAAENPENPEGGKKGKKGRKKLLILLPVLALAVGAAVFFFVIRPRMTGGEELEEEQPPEPVEIPVVYQLGETVSVHALPVWGSAVVYLEEPEEIPEEDGGQEEEPEAEEPGEEKTGEEAGEEGTSGEEESGKEADGSEEEEQPISVTYRYEDLLSPGTLATIYTTLLTAEDVGFSAVDEELIRQDLPELAVESGSVFLAKNVPEEAGKAVTIWMEWSAELCTVTAELANGSVRNPPEPVLPPALSAGEVLDYFNSVSPALLGLTGSSMEEYDVYLQDGSVLIDNLPCVRVNAYQVDSQTGTNEIAGNYFISLDGRHVYRLDVASDSVEELRMSE